MTYASVTVICALAVGPRKRKTAGLRPGIQNQKLRGGILALVTDLLITKFLFLEIIYLQLGNEREEIQNIHLSLHVFASKVLTQ